MLRAGPLVFALLASQAEAVVLDFEGLPFTDADSGDVVPSPASVLTDDFRDEGVVFGLVGVSGGVAVVQGFGMAPSSGVNTVAGLDALGHLPRIEQPVTEDVHFHLVVPGTDAPAQAGRVSFTVGDHCCDVDRFIIRAYDVAGSLLVEQPEEGSARFSVTLEQPGIHRVHVDFLGSAGYTLDDLDVGTPEAAPTCGLRSGSLASLQPPVDLQAIFDDEATCLPRRIPSDILVPDFTVDPDQDLPHGLLEGVALRVYVVACPCPGVLLVRKAGDLVHATLR